MTRDKREWATTGDPVQTPLLVAMTLEVMSDEVASARAEAARQRMSNRSQPWKMCPSGRRASLQTAGTQTTPALAQEGRLVAAVVAALRRATAPCQTSKLQLHPVKKRLQYRRQAAAALLLDR